ncbi:MAG: hypothetical protein IIA14_14595 [SAR324 cluster bacterium]|nr:hypothetical protein [SAR324 cluster bacterium]
MKRENLKISSTPDENNTKQTLYFTLEEGTSIVFDPTGEQWRISILDDQNVAFEKLS